MQLPPPDLGGGVITICGVFSKYVLFENFGLYLLDFFKVKEQLYLCVCVCVLVEGFQ